MGTLLGVHPSVPLKHKVAPCVRVVGGLRRQAFVILVNGSVRVFLAVGRENNNKQTPFLRNHSKSSFHFGF